MHVKFKLNAKNLYNLIFSLLGSFATRKEFPWMVLIDGNFRTSGVLISHKHVVSILSVVADWNMEEIKYVPPENPERIKVYLGVLRSNDELSNEIRASEVIFHPDYTFSDKLPVINIALITLSKILDFDQFVRPICLWPFKEDMDLLKSSKIYAVGYGKSGANDLTNARKYAKMYKVTQEDCRAQFGGQLNFMEKTRTFCVKGNNEGSPCHGDESLFVKFNEKWYWAGFSVIRFYQSSNPNICSISPVLYEDATKYTDWLLSYADY